MTLEFKKDLTLLICWAVGAVSLYTLYPATHTALLLTSWLGTLSWLILKMKKTKKKR